MNLLGIGFSLNRQETTILVGSHLKPQEGKKGEIRMSQPDKVKVEVEIPEDLWPAFDWYVRQTQFWISNEDAPKSYSDFIVYCLRLQLEAEAESPQLAHDLIKSEMKLLLP